MNKKPIASGSRRSRKPVPEKNQPQTQVDTESQTYKKALAYTALRPSVNAAAVVEIYGKPFGDLNVDALIDVLAEGMKGIEKGDLKRAEGMLFAQAHALQAIFMNLARRATSQQYLKQWEAYLRMALKAQNQCRMTLETLTTIKNPPMVIARQANINNGGQQQVNNAASPRGLPARAEKSEVEQTELLEASDGQWMDTRAQGTPGTADSQMEALAALDRATQR